MIEISETPKNNYQYSMKLIVDGLIIINNVEEKEQF